MDEKNIALYHYSTSPYARRIGWYLALRGIPYVQCLNTTPSDARPDPDKLAVVHRRIPILSVGRDVYLDTRLMLRKLEAIYPSRPRLGASGPDQATPERLLEVLAIHGGVFRIAMNVLPTDLPMLKDPAWFKDRSDFAGTPLSAEALERNRPQPIYGISRNMALLETTLLADGRDWVLKTYGPALADIEAIWLLHWLTGISNALPNDEPKGQIDYNDALVAAEGLRVGDSVVVWPTDTGASHKDSGKLVSIDGDEVVIEVIGEKGLVRVHAPRHGFRVEKLDRFEKCRSSNKL